MGGAEPHTASVIILRWSANPATARVSCAAVVCQRPGHQAELKYHHQRDAAATAAVLDRELEPAPPMNHYGYKLSELQRALKRLFDILGVFVILVLLGWLVLVVAVGVALSVGRPVIFRHERVGLHGSKFGCLKFRSMIVNAQEVLEALLATDPDAREQWNRDFKLKNDPRITPFGRFIRRTSLDELPQLWNVLKGEMSLVGPRPVVEEELTQYYGGAMRDYCGVKPGLTGLWQVSGRNDLSYEERVALDSEYVNNWSLLTDLSIVLRTAVMLVRPHGAY
jgi:lipopolysaccharide/colanic/teichoic acid biosynthesis glycosyltransferase